MTAKEQDSVFGFPRNLLQANALIKYCDRLFKKSARAWERGQNSGDDKIMARSDKQSVVYAERAEAILKPLGIECDYPGLYPSFKVGGFVYYSTESAVSAAMETTNPHAVNP